MAAARCRGAGGAGGGGQRRPRRAGRAVRGHGSGRRRDHRPAHPARRRATPAPGPAWSASAPRPWPASIAWRPPWRLTSAPTIRWSSSAACSTCWASLIRRSSSGCAGWTTTAPRRSRATGGARRLPAGQPHGRRRRAGRRARLGAGPSRRPDGGPGLAVRAGLAVRFGSAGGRPGGARPAHRRLRDARPPHRRPGRPALVGGAGHPALGPDLRAPGLGPPVGGEPVGRAGGHRPAGVRERVRPAGPDRRPATRPAAELPSRPRATSQGPCCTTPPRPPSWWRRSASSSSATSWRATEGRVQFHARVAARVLATVERELALGPAQVAAHGAALASLGFAPTPSWPPPSAPRSTPFPTPGWRSSGTRCRPSSRVANPTYL